MHITYKWRNTEIYPLGRTDSPNVGTHMVIAKQNKLKKQLGGRWPRSGAWSCHAVIFSLASAVHTLRYWPNGGFEGWLLFSALALITATYRDNGIHCMVASAACGTFWLLSTLYSQWNASGLSRPTTNTFDEARLGLQRGKLASTISRSVVVMNCFSSMQFAYQLSAWQRCRHVGW